MNIIISLLSFTLHCNKRKKSIKDNNKISFLLKDDISNIINFALQIHTFLLIHKLILDSFVLVLIKGVTIAHFFSYN